MRTHSSYTRQVNMFRRCLELHAGFRYRVNSQMSTIYPPPRAPRLRSTDSPTSRKAGEETGLPVCGERSSKTQKLTPTYDLETSRSARRLRRMYFGRSRLGLVWVKSGLYFTLVLIAHSCECGWVSSFESLAWRGGSVSTLWCSSAPGDWDDTSL